MAARSRSGVMASRRVLSCISTSASRAVRRLMVSAFPGPVNIGSEEMVTINEMAWMTMEIAGKKLTLQAHLRSHGGPWSQFRQRVDHARLGWEPTMQLQQGLARTYAWIEAQVRSPLRVGSVA